MYPVLVLIMLAMPGSFLCGVCMLSACPCEFPLGAPGFSHKGPVCKDVQSRQLECMSTGHQIRLFTAIILIKQTY